MPKSKVRKKSDSPTRPAGGSAQRALAPSPRWYPVLMAVVLLVGLAYLVVFYLTSSGTSPHIPVMASLHYWNFAIGFGVLLLGLVMAVRWR